MPTFKWVHLKDLGSRVSLPPSSFPYHGPFEFSKRELLALVGELRVHVNAQTVPTDSFDYQFSFSCLERARI